MTLSNATKKVLRLARVIQNYWDAELPKRHRDYPFVHPGEDSGPPPPEEQELRNLLVNLPDDAVYQLLVIMGLGRDEISTSEIATRLERLKETFESKDAAIAQIMAKASLADYLEDGLERLKQDKIDVDALLEPVKSRG